MKNLREVVLDLTLKAGERSEEITERVKGQEAPAALQELKRREQIDEPAPVATNRSAEISPDANRSPPPAEPPTKQLASTSIKAAAFAVQVAAHRMRHKAEGVQAMLQDHGYTAYVVEANVPGSGRYYRVRVGPFGTLEEARAVVANMQSRLAEQIPAFWIVPYQQ